MSILHISPDIADRIPQLKANNNSWRQYRDSGTVIIFVHGVLSDALACWYNKKSKTYWPDLVAGDPTFAGANVFLGGYYTAFDSTDYGLADCAQELFSALFAADEHPAVLDHPRLVFVCHSLGGVVVRYMIERWQQYFRDKQIGLLLMASPSLGSGYANVFGNTIALFQHEAGHQLSWKSDILNDLDVRFSDLLARHLVPSLVGMEACEHRFLVYYRWLAPLGIALPRIVSPESAGRYFRPARPMPKTNHSSIVKPDSEQHVSHRLLREFYTERVQKELPAHYWAPRKDFRRATDPRGAQFAQDNVFQAGRLAWDVQITEDGDARNELTYTGITEAQSKAGAVYLMRPIWVQSGHTSRYKTDASRTSAQINLRLDEIHPRLVRQAMLFGIAPSAGQPENALLQSIDFNVYSMNVEEFQRKETENDDDVDFVQKSIRWEKLDELIMSVQLPAAMQLLLNEPVSVQGFQLIRSDNELDDLEVYDELLTLEARKYFFYSPLLRVAILRLPSPQPWTAYRISWRLGRYTDPAPNAARDALVEQKRRALLSARPLFDETVELTPALSTTKELILEALAQLGAQVIAEVNRSLSKLDGETSVKMDLQQLDLSLMAIELLSGPPEHEVLRVVAGMNVPTAYWRLILPVGNGIAGRAAKRLQPRKYCPSAQDILENDAYIPFDSEDSNRQHKWLLSIPLVEECSKPYPYGVVNIGTFDRSSAKSLNALSDKSIDLLTKYINQPFLKAILDAAQGSVAK